MRFQPETCCSDSKTFNKVLSSVHHFSVYETDNSAEKKFLAGTFNKKYIYIIPVIKMVQLRAIFQR